MNCAGTDVAERAADRKRIAFRLVHCEDRASRTQPEGKEACLAMSALESSVVGVQKPKSGRGLVVPTTCLKEVGSCIVCDGISHNSTAGLT